MLELKKSNSILMARKSEAFKPRPEQCSNLEWLEKQVQPSGSPSLGPTDAPKQ